MAKIVIKASTAANRFIATLIQTEVIASFGYAPKQTNKRNVLHLLDFGPIVVAKFP